MPLEPREEDPSSLLGVELRGFVTEALLGRGASSWVFRARHARSRRLVALKVLSLESVRSEDMVERMRREASLLAMIQDPHVIEVIDFGMTEDARPFLVMELLEGRTLNALIQAEAPVGPERFYAVARQLSRGLQAAHDIGVVHRDLKPANVMLVPTGAGEQVKLFDFGVARVARTTGALEGSRRSELSMTGEDMILGTPRYMAPEQFLSSRASQPSADLYGLGVIFYELLAGRTPFDGPMVTLLEDHLFRAPPPLESRTGFEDLVLDLLAKRPEDRPATAGRVLDALDARWQQAGREPSFPSFPSSPEKARIARDDEPDPYPSTGRLHAPSEVAEALLEDMLAEETRRLPEPPAARLKKASVRVSSSFAELSAERETNAEQGAFDEAEEALLRPAMVAQPRALAIPSVPHVPDLDVPTQAMMLDAIGASGSNSTSGVTQVSSVVEAAWSGGISLSAPDEREPQERVDVATGDTQLDWSPADGRDTALDGDVKPADRPAIGRTVPDLRFSSTLTDTAREDLEAAEEQELVVAMVAAPIVSQETVARDPALLPRAPFAGTDVTRTMAGPSASRLLTPSEGVRPSSVLVRPVRPEELDRREGPMVSLTGGAPASASLHGSIPVARPRREDGRSARVASVQAAAPTPQLAPAAPAVVVAAASAVPATSARPAIEVNGDGDRIVWIGGRDPRDTLPPNRIAWTGRADGAPDKVRPHRTEPPAAPTKPGRRDRQQVETLALAFLVGAALALILLAGLLVMRNQGWIGRDTPVVVSPLEK